MTFGLPFDQQKTHNGPIYKKLKCFTFHILKNILNLFVFVLTNIKHNVNDRKELMHAATNVLSIFRLDGLLSCWNFIDNKADGKIWYKGTGMEAEKYPYNRNNFLCEMINCLGFNMYLRR